MFFALNLKKCSKTKMVFLFVLTSVQVAMNVYKRRKVVILISISWLVYVLYRKCLKCLHSMV